MSDCGGGKWVKGRKQHRCEYCLGPIPTGEHHYNYRGLYGGEWQNWRMHSECFDDYDINGDGAFMPGDGTVPDRIRQLAG